VSIQSLFLHEKASFFPSYPANWFYLNRDFDASIPGSDDVDLEATMGADYLRKGRGVGGGERNRSAGMVLCAARKVMHAHLLRWRSLFEPHATGPA
jgi:hypothetical protein